MPDSMTFRARDGQGQCQLCLASPATLQFDIQCDGETSRQQGSCCLDCACNLLDALAQIKLQPAKITPPQSEGPSQPSTA
jgi:hypothetical protein